MKEERKLIMHLAETQLTQKCGHLHLGGREGRVEK